MSDPVLQIRGLGVEIAPPGREPVTVLHGVDLEVDRGSVLGIVGESGSGKTMLLRAIMDILPPHAQRDWQSIRFDGADVTASFGRTRLPISMIFQDPLTSFNPLRTIGGHLLEIVKRFRSIRGAAARAAVIAELERVGLEAPEQLFARYPHELSGGMRQRVMIAMALLSDPMLLVADEPTTALDATIQMQILRLLAQVQRDTGLTIVIVTHDLGVAAALCDRVAVMKDGEIVEIGAVSAVFEAPTHPYTRALLAAQRAETAQTETALTETALTETGPAEEDARD